MSTASHGVAHAVAAGISVVLLAAAAQAGDVKELGPAPMLDGSNPFTGRVSAVVCSPTDPSRYFIAGADGGVWRTADGGVTWMPLTDFMPTTAMGALALDPTNENIIYAGTGEANYAHHSRFGLGIFKSTNGGDTWVQLGESTFGGRTISRIIVSPQNPQIVYAAVARAGGFPALSAAKGHAGVNGPVGVFRSLDGGTTWNQLLNGLPNQAATDLAIDPVNAGILYAAIGHIFGAAENGIYKTLDGGDSWTKLAGGLPTTDTSTGRISVAVAPSRPQRLYALTSFFAGTTGNGASTRGAYSSDDGGTTWAVCGLGNIQATYGWYLSVIAIHPTDPNTLFMGGVPLHRSTDGGATWQVVTPPHVDMHGPAWDAAGRFLMGDDGGVHRTADLGDTWTSLNEGLGLIQFYAGLSTHPSDDAYIIGGTQDNGSNYRSADALLWTQIFGGDGGWTQIDQANPLRMFFQYQGSGTLYRTEDGGATVVASGSGISSLDRNAFFCPHLINPADSTRMLYATHRIYRSVNSGVNWSTISGDVSGGSGGAVRSIAFGPTDPNYVYIMGNGGNLLNNGRLQRSTNGGASFTALLTGLPGWSRVTREIFVHPTDPRTIYLAGPGFGATKVRRSIDAGDTWTALDAGLPDVPVNTVAVDVRPPTPVLYAGAEDGLYRSLDGGTKWGRYGRGLPHTPVIDLRLEPARQRLLIATQGRGLWSVPLACPGDSNCDGLVTWRDIDYFVVTMNDNESAWRAEFAPQSPTCPFGNNDVNGDGFVTWRDIQPFVAVMNTTCLP